VAGAATVELVVTGAATVELVATAFVAGEVELDVTTGDAVVDLTAAFVVELVAAFVVEVAALVAGALVATVAAPPARFPLSQWYCVGLKQALLQAW